MVYCFMFVLKRVLFFAKILENITRKYRKTEILLPQCLTFSQYDRNPVTSLLLIVNERHP